MSPTLWKWIERERQEKTRKDGQPFEITWVRGRERGREVINGYEGTSLAVQWLTLCASKAGGASLGN